MNSTLTAKQVKEASTAEDLFGKNPNEVKQHYSQYAKALHPDLVQGFEDEFKKLTKFYEEAVKAIVDGSYGDPKRERKIDAIRISTKRHAYEVLTADGHDGAAMRYWGNNENGETVMLKVAINGNNDLLQNEAKVLKHLLKQEEPNEKDLVDQVFYPYVETFGYKFGKNKPQQTNVFQKPVGAWYTLEQVQQKHGAIHPKDMVWMMRRALVAIGAVHRYGYVYGGFTPANVLIEPNEHRMRLTNFYHSVELDQPLKTIDGRYKALYPKSVMQKKAATAQTDIQMVADVMGTLVNGAGMPTPLRAFLKGCAHSHNAWDLHTDMTELLIRMWGPLRFRHFQM